MPQKIKIKKYSFAQLSPSVKEELRKQVLLNFPYIKAFKSRFYYQIPPNYIFIVRIGNKIVGQGYFTEKVRTIDNRKYKIGGIGISINIKFQGKGIGKNLTRIFLNFAKSRKCDFIMGATTNPAAKHIIKNFGFTQFKRAITYKDTETDKITKEKEGVFVKDFLSGKLVKMIESSKNPIYMGKGAW